MTGIIIMHHHACMTWMMINHQSNSNFESKFKIYVTLARNIVTKNGIYKQLHGTDRVPSYHTRSTFTQISEVPAAAPGTSIRQQPASRLLVGLLNFVVHVFHWRWDRIGTLLKLKVHLAMLQLSRPQWCTYCS